MKISEYAVNNPQLTILAVIMIAIIGLSTLFTISRSEDPEIPYLSFPIVIIYPGTSPKDMEDMVVDIIEEKVSSLQDIKRVFSNIGDGLAVINVEYNSKSDVNEKYQELVREVNALSSQLPKDIYSIEVKKFVPSDVNIIQSSLISESAGLDKLKEYSEKLKELLEKLPQLKNVKINGLPDKTIRIDLQMDKISLMRIPLDAVLSSIQSESVTIPGGSIEAGTKSFNIQTSGNYNSIDEIKNTIVYSNNGKNTQLKVIADVYFDFEKSQHITRLDAYRSVFVVAALKPGENITNMQEKYKSVFDSFKKQLPSNIDFIVQFDQADNVNKRLAGLGIDFLIAILLVSITLLPLGYRAATIVMFSIPLSLFMGLIIINAFGYNLNQLSIVGLVVALGLLVDDSIVVVENIERWIREGHTRLEATVNATKQIGLAVLGTTATIIIAFLPLAFLPEASGDFIRSLPVTIIACVFSSMIVSLTFIPFISSKILKDGHTQSEGNIFLRGLKKVISGSYSVILDKALKHPVITLIITVVIFSGSLFLFPVIGFSLFPASEKPQFMIDITTPLQSNLKYTNSLTKTIEKQLKEIKEIEHFSTNVGRGNPSIYYNIIPENERTDYSQIFVQLKENVGNEKKIQIIEQLRNKWSPYHGAKVEVKNFEQGPPITAPIEIRISGDNLDTLRNKAQIIENLLNNTKGTIYVNNPLKNSKSDIKIVINKDKTGMLGLSTIMIDKIIRLSVAGMDIGQLTDENGENYKIKVNKYKDNISSLEAFKNLYFNNKSGNVIPLSDIASIEFVSTPVSINHRNKIRTVSVSSFLQKGYLADNIIQEVQKKLENIKLPNGYSFEIGGEAEQRTESFSGLSAIILLTAFLFIGVLLLEFKTYKSTLIVLSVIPLGIVGAVSALFLTGNSLSFVAIIGLISLAGIEVKNTILLVDFTNQLREKGMELNQAIREAGEIRFLPIVLTSMTAIGGLMPIALSINPMISPLAIVIIGGLISSTLLSRIVTPVIYKLLPPRINNS